jgi:protein subunit release factor B
MEIHPAALPPVKLLAQCDVRRLRRSGPGGQHRNKVETAVALHHKPSGAKAEASERRSQAENQVMALFRLRVNLALEVRLSAAVGGAASSLWQSRLSGGKIRVSESHEDFPAILAEVLDVLAAHRGDVQAAAVQLGCTASQLVKFLKQEPRAFLLTNRWREESGLHRLQ